MSIRSLIFKSLDLLKGGHISKNLKEIELVNGLKDESLILNYQQERFKEIGTYAQKNTDFYKGVTAASLKEYPVINKSILKNNLAGFISKAYQIENLKKVITSGSTGTPFVSYQNIAKSKRNSADAIYFGSLAGYNLGDPLFYLKIWSTNNSKSRRIQFVQNIYPIDVLNFAGKNILSFLHKINAVRGPININGYASALEELCKHLDAEPYAMHKRLHISSIIAQSEGLADHTKERLHNYFNCVPCSRYSNVENGIIAQQTKDENTVFKINRASYILEILKINTDEPAEVGELGRIVVTDLFNRGMPFLRYDTGDVGRFKVKANGESDTNYLDEIQGRKLDLLLNTNGEIISSYIMYKNMFSYPEIDQYQLIQQDEKSYDFIISMKGNFDKEDRLKNEFLTYLGADARFTIKYVDEIPLLSSGKRRKIENNYLKKKTE